jgi:diaminohydroxyphosphoribosylaminopyrimidine deaminase / 5-amino-6-(5-phosphoribosylamino)uracil reductase
MLFLGWSRSISASDHRRFMIEALRTATVGLGAAQPNPCVGCVIVADGAVVGRGGHRAAGCEHAEVSALAEAGDRAAGATVYVTLEPCCHHGRQPPCTDQLIAAGVRHVVVGHRDPDGRVAGKGIAALEAAGITTQISVLEEQCLALNPGYLHRQRLGRPRVLLKTAATLDGAVATAGGMSQWISSPEARRFVHGLRARFGAVLVGAGTVRTDAPRLSARFEEPPPWRGNDHQPLRLVASHSGEVPGLPSGATAWLLSPAAGAAPSYDRQLGSEGTHLDWPEILSELAAAGVNSILCEGGSGLAKALLEAGVVDEWAAVIAPMSLRGSGLPTVAGEGIDDLADAQRGRLARLCKVGQDAVVWTTFDEQPSFADQEGLLEWLYREDA